MHNYRYLVYFFPSVCIYSSLEAHTTYSKYETDLTRCLVRADGKFSNLPNFHYNLYTSRLRTVPEVQFVFRDKLGFRHPSKRPCTACVAISYSTDVSRVRCHDVVVVSSLIMLVMMSSASRHTCSVRLLHVICHRQSRRFLVVREDNKQNGTHTPLVSRVVKKRILSDRVQPVRPLRVDDQLLLDVKYFSTTV